MPRGIPNRTRHFQTYRCRRVQIIDGEKRMVGELVPEAITWLRVESNVASGYLDEVTVSGGELMDALARYCPQVAPEYGLKIKETAS